MKQRGPGGADRHQGNPRAGEGASVDPNRRRPSRRSTRPAPTIGRWTPSSPPTSSRRSGSRPFHMKPRRGSIATSRCCGSGRPRPIWSRPRRCRSSGPGTSPIRFSSSISRPSAKRWADLGSGGGFPGVVLACAMAGTPGASVHLVERIAKKAAFLREAIRVTSISGQSYISLRSGIMWIESPARSIASPRVRWLRYINSSALRSR